MRTVHCSDRCGGGVPARGAVPARGYLSGGCTCPGGVPAQGVYLPGLGVYIPPCTDAETPPHKQND